MQLNLKFMAQKGETSGTNQITKKPLASGDIEREKV
jgi:hypothetical protein